MQQKVKKKKKKKKHRMYEIRNRGGDEMETGDQSTQIQEM